ncbi:hypothetical protein JRI60_35615 [Archangium violaceum]|uniref:hypothetical protein n=1 Tax=Archangium violaceum TaxID=83451 RepID=UPI001951D3D6|nr:hypothetical protein [Archangium violaceum]QRN94432.1 hypothetical protein JRI60_35615 [Archangium violaceum]
MTAPISSGSARYVLPQSQKTMPSDTVGKTPVEGTLAPVQKQRLPTALDTSVFEQEVARRGMPALPGNGGDNTLQKSLGKQALIGNKLEVAGNALATAQAGLELAASLASRPQFAGLRNEAASALSGVTARMPLDIANRVAGAINGGTDLHQLDVLQGLAHTQGPLAAGNLEAGPYSAEQLGQYGDPTALAGQVLGGVSDLASGVSDLGGLGDMFRKPASKPSAPELKPSAPESRPTAKPSTSDIKPSAPDIKPSSVAGKADDIAKGLLKTGGKAAGRFVPGLNVAMAGLDIANAVTTIKDPKASLGDKVTSGIVAGGSVLAATNIPIVSQIGGAISTGASIAGEVVKNFGGDIKKGAEKIGKGIKDTAEKVGDGIKDTAKKVGEGIKDFFKGW